MNNIEEFITSINNFIYKSEKFINKYEKNKPIKLIPPYNCNCDHHEIDNCKKKASYKYNNKYYCWLHMK